MRALTFRASDLRFSRSRHHGEARLGHERKVHNSEGPYSHSDFRFSSFFWGPLPPEKRIFPSPKFIHKDLRNLLMHVNEEILSFGIQCEVHNKLFYLLGFFTKQKFSKNCFHSVLKMLCDNNRINLHFSLQDKASRCSSVIFLPSSIKVEH